MSKPIQTLLAAYVDNLVAAESLVEERVPVMDRPAMESRLQDFFLFQQFSGVFSILQNSHLLNCNLIQLL